MVLFVILEPIFTILVAALLISQCLVPELTGRPWFPMVRRSWKVKTDIASAREDIAVAALTDELRKLKGETPNAEPDGPDSVDPSQWP